MSNNFDNSTKLTKISLLISGITVYNGQEHQTIKRFISSFLYYFNILSLYSVIFGEVYWLVDGIQIGRDFVEMSLTAPCITISILSTLKTAPLYYKKDFLYNLIDALRRIHPNPQNYEKVQATSRLEKEKTGMCVKVQATGRLEKEKTGMCVKVQATGRLEKEKIGMVKDTDITDENKQMTEVEIANESEKILKTVMIVFITICVSVLITFLLAPLFVMYLGYFKTGEMKIKYPFAVMYWFDVYEFDFWPLVYFHQVWAMLIYSDNLYFAAIIVCVQLFGTETLFYTVCMYLEMHFRILCHRFENIQVPTSTAIHKLVAGVKTHQLLMDLVEQTEALFSLPVLFHILISSLLLCLSAFNISVAQDLGSLIAFVTFLMLSLSQISFLCLFGDKLMTSSAEVSHAIYKCPWYEFDVNTKKAVLIILRRTQKPCKLTAANFADLNLRAFTTILSRSWSYFALLKTFYN